jgi:hypothetical protein
MLNYKTATGSLFEIPDKRGRNQDGDIRAGGGKSVVGQRPLWVYSVMIILVIYFCNDWMCLLYDR